MKRRWWAALGVVVVAVAIAAAAIHENRITPVAQWATADPILAPKQSQELTVGSAAQDRTQALQLPAGHLAGTDWYLPITRSSAVTYVLHDGQARWLAGASEDNLAGAPTDPVGFLIYSPNGQRLAWQDGGAVEILSAPKFHRTLMAGASLPYFTPDSHFDYTTVFGSAVLVHSPYPVRKLSGAANAGHHPFVFGGQDFVYDDGGRITMENLQTGIASPVATLRPSRWPQMVDALSYGQTLAVMMRRPTALPAYLVIVKTPRGISWYRWQTGLKPQIGLSDQHLVINNLAPSGQLVVWGTRHLHPLPQSSGLFSQSPSGIIFQTSQGFIRLSAITP